MFSSKGFIETEARIIGGVSAHKMFTRLNHALENVDEFVNFKKFLVTALNQDRDRIKKFIEKD